MVETGKLTQFIIGQPGYFRTECEDDFPWNAEDRSVWYALLVLEGGKITRYGFTSSMPNKQGLVNALESLAETDEALLMGVWNGQWSTHLFVLGRDKAIVQLKNH